jgi:hypothetical protein
MSTEPKYLQSDPKRQAVHAIKGYEYQIWQSVLAWINLAEDEVLFLEGAEDFDVYQSGSGTEVCQVKHTSASISLRSEYVVEALNNFWALKKLNPGRQIKYRYLTIAEPTREKGNPFDQEVGLLFWERCKNAQTDLGRLREFLKGLDNLSPDLSTFIQQSDDQELRAELVVPISWDTGSPSYDQIREEVEKRVIYHGDRYSVFPDDSKKSVPHLRDKACETICSKTDRRLDRRDFLRVFADATKINLSKGILNALLSSLGRDPRLTPPGNHASLHKSPDLKNSVPPDPQPLLKRERLISDINGKWGASEISFLTGSAATGKTTLIKLLIHDQSWYWMSFRGARPQEIVMQLRKAAHSLLPTHEWIGVVLDDLGLGDDFHAFEAELIAFMDLLLSRKRRIAITSQSPMPTILGERFNPKGIFEMTVPNLDETELHAFVVAHDCPEGQWRDVWTTIIQARTRGHPKLAHAQILNLRSRGWPIPTGGDLVDNEPLANVYQEARQRLFAEVPDADARDLAYRLSILAYPFRRQHALKLGAKALGDPPGQVPKPGEAFDRLLHGWIEPFAPDYFELTPLLARAADKVYDSNMLRSMHVEAANSVLEIEPINAVEAQALVYHGFAGQYGLPVQVVIAELIRHLHDDEWSKMRQDYLWLLPLATEPGQQIFPSDAATSLLLRIFQYQMASETGNSDLVIKIREAYEHEINRIHDINLKDAMRFVFLLQIVMRLEVSFSLRRVALLIMEALNILKRRKVDGVPGLAEGLTFQELANGLLDFVSPRSYSVEDLLDFFEAIEEDPFSTKSEIVSSLEENLERLLFIFDHAWTGVSNIDESRLRKMVEVFEAIAARSIQWEANNCAAVAYRCIGIIRVKHAKDFDTALDVLAKASAELPGDNFLLKHMRACLLHDTKEFATALEIWVNLAEKWQFPPLQVAFMISRWGQMSAASVNDWSTAARMARYGETVAFDRSFEVRAIGFRADEAFALWKNGSYEDAIATFASVIDAFRFLPDPTSDLSSHTLQRRVGHAIVWVNRQVIPIPNNEDHVEPPVAWFSEPELDEKMRQLPIQSPIGLWSLLAQVECRLNLGDWVLRRLEMECRYANPPNIQIQVGLLRFEQSFIHNEYDRILSLYLKCLCEFRDKPRILAEQTLPEDLRNIIQAYISSGLDAHSSEILVVLSAAALRLAGQGQMRDAPLAKWRTDCSQFGVSDRRVLDWLTFLERASTATTNELLDIMKNSDQNDESRLLASICIITRKDEEPHDLLYASVLLTKWTSTAQFCHLIEDNLARLMFKSWMNVADTQRFKLLAPNLSVKAIIEACNHSSQGIRKAALICLAARHAVSLNMRNMVAELEKIASTGCSRMDLASSPQILVDQPRGS